MCEPERQKTQSLCYVALNTVLLRYYAYIGLPLVHVTMDFVSCVIYMRLKMNFILLWNVQSITFNATSYLKS